MADWGVRKYLDLSTAAYILALYQDAKDNNIERSVMFNGKAKTLQDIRTYLIKKNDEHIRTEEDLRRHCPRDRPESVTWIDSQVGRPTQADRRNSRSVQGPDTWHDVAPHMQAAVCNETAHATRPTPSDMVPNSMGTAANGMENSDDEFDLPNIDNDASMLFDNSGLPLDQFDPSLIYVDSALNDMYTMEPQIPLNPTYTEPLSRLSPMMSTTPQFFKFRNPDSEIARAQELEEFVRAILGPGRKALDASPESEFIRYCCEACVYAGQEEEDGVRIASLVALRHRAINSATYAFGKVTSSQHFSDSLHLLSFMRIMLSEYGHDDLARTILQSLEGVVDSPLTHSGMVVCRTIRFMSATTDWRDADHRYWRQETDRISRDAVATLGDKSKLAVSAQYNRAWVMLEVDDNEKALEVLNNGRASCESVFGINHPQTIAWLSSQARALLYTQNGTSARTLLEESVETRVEKAFTRSHPLYWSTKYRQGCYLLRIADLNLEVDPTERQRCWDSGTDLLRQVAVWRAATLGLENAQTATVLKWLGKYLQKQGKHNEAANVRQWCIHEVQISRGFA